MIVIEERMRLSRRTSEVRRVEDEMETRSVAKIGSRSRAALRERARLCDSVPRCTLLGEESTRDAVEESHELG